MHVHRNTQAGVTFLNDQYQKSCKLFTAVQLGSPPIFQIQICFRQITCQNSAGSCIRLAPHQQLSFRNNDPSRVSKWTSNCSLHSSFGSFTNQGQLQSWIHYCSFVIKRLPCNSKNWCRGTQQSLGFTCSFTEHVCLL